MTRLKDINIPSKSVSGRQSDGPMHQQLIDGFFNR